MEQQKISDLCVFVRIYVDCDYTDVSEFNFTIKKPWIRPPIDTVLDQSRKKITGNVSGLLDFAILG